MWFNLSVSLHWRVTVTAWGIAGNPCRKTAGDIWAAVPRDSSHSSFHALGYFLLFVRVFFPPTFFPATLFCCFAFMLTSQVWSASHSCRRWWFVRERVLWSDSISGQRSSPGWWRWPYHSCNVCWCFDKGKPCLKIIYHIALLLLLFLICLQRPPFMPPPMGSMPPPPGMMFPPGMPPVTAPGTPAMPPAEEIWVENKTPDGKVRWIPETTERCVSAAAVKMLSDGPACGGSGSFKNNCAIVLYSHWSS